MAINSQDFSSVPALFVPGAAQPARAQQGLLGNQYQYLGLMTVLYMNYMDISTAATSTLIAQPGNYYTIGATIAANNANTLPSPPPDGRWQGEIPQIFSMTRRHWVQRAPRIKGLSTPMSKSMRRGKNAS